MKKTVVIAICVILVTVTFGQEKKSLVLRGTVVDGTAQPVAGAEVAAYKRQHTSQNASMYAIMLAPIVKTDTQGRFKMSVPVGSEHDYQWSIFIVARKTGLAYAWDGLNYGFRDMAEGNFNLILEKPVVLSGKLFEADGNPVAGAKVRAIPKNQYLHRLSQRPILGPEEWFTTKTDAQGNFTFDYFGPDVVTDFMVETPDRSFAHRFTTHLDEDYSYEVSKSQVKLVLPGKTTVRGRVIDKRTGAGISGVSLALQPHGESDNEHLYYPYQFSTGEGGNFLIDAVPPGTHALSVFTPREETGDWIGKTNSFTIGPNETEMTVTMRVEKAGLIRILVRDQDTGRAMPGIQLGIVNSQYMASAEDRGGFYRNGLTGGDGIAIVRCPVGRCDVSAYRAHYHNSSPVPIMVRKGRTSKTEIRLEKKSRVTGTVTDESGRPVEGVFVAVQPAGDEAFTDSSGGFALKSAMSGVPAKRLFARHIGSNLAAAAVIEDPAKPVRVILKPAVTIVGQITDTDGTGIPAARATLDAAMARSYSRFTEVITDAGGFYEIKAIAPEQPGFGYVMTTAALGYGTREYEKISVVRSSSGTVKIPTTALKPADVAIGGQVVYADGTPAARVQIRLGDLLDAPQLERRTVTDANGRFVISSVCKGPLKLQVTSGGGRGGSSSLQLQAEGGDTDLKVVLGHSGLQTHHASLLGKPLPTLAELGLRSASVLSGRKQVLVCFWDVNQRPSRNCVGQLVRGEKLLAGKNVSVVLVQTPAVPDRMMIEWLRKYKVTFPVGKVRTGPEGLSKTWGVQSLPWLILTDNDHKVTHEGLTIQQLEAQLLR